MRQVKVSYTFERLPVVLTRGAHVLVALIDKQNRLVVGAKDIYPQGISRLIGGGIDGAESPVAAAVREMAEETGITFEAKDFIPICQVQASLTETKTGKQYQFTTYIFKIKLGAKTPVASSDLQGLFPLTQDELTDLIERYKNLPDDLITFTGQNFSWRDYGQFYAFIHQLVKEELAG